MENLKSVNGIGETQTKSINHFFSSDKNLTVIKNLIQNLNVQDHIVLKTKGVLSGRHLMFTGGLKKISRSEAKLLAENLGAKIVSNISKKTDFLVVGNEKPISRKINEAKNLNIKILSEEDWNKIIGE